MPILKEYQKLCTAIEQKGTRGNRFNAETLERLVETKRLFELSGKTMLCATMVIGECVSEQDFIDEFDLLIEKWLQAGQKTYEEKAPSVCGICNGTGTIMRYFNAGDHFSAGPSPYSEMRATPCVCRGSE